MLFNILRGRKTPSTFSEKRNAFFIILEAILRCGLRNDPNSTGFIRYFDQLFPTLENALGPMIFDILRGRETPSTFSEKRNAFLIILEAILRFGLQNDWNSTGFIRYFEQLFRMLQIALGPMLFQHFARS